MRSFFKMFFASLLSIVVFFVLCIFILIAAVARLTTKEQPDIRSKSILVINLSETFHDRKQDNPLGALSGTGDTPGLYDVIRLVKNAKDDDDISGIYIEGDANANGFASSN